jgi:hypothetical protein
MSFAAQFERLHERAVAATGFNDFGDTTYIEPMKLALADYDRYAKFSETGAQIVSANLAGLLAARLLAEQGFKTHPEFAAAPLVKPLIIIGMLRTGSTALLQLLSKDPGNQWLPPWLGAAPMPRPPRALWDSNFWYQQMAQALAQLNEMSPDLKSAHPMHADTPDECRFGFDQSFWSPGLATTATTKEYAAWCIGTDAGYSYKRYKRILGLIAGGSTQRWLLKDPSHLWGLDALLKIFPDACIIYTHREPVEAITSMASLFYELRHLTEPLPREIIGRDVMLHWARAQAKGEIVRKRADPARFIDIHIKDIAADPIGTATRIYRHFDIPVTEEAVVCWQEHVASDPKTGRSPKKVTPEELGYTAQDVYANIGGYYDRYRQLYSR